MKAFVKQRGIKIKMCFNFLGGSTKQQLKQEKQKKFRVLDTVDNLQEHLARFNDLFYDLEPFLTKKQNKKYDYIFKRFSDGLDLIEDLMSHF